MTLNQHRWKWEWDQLFPRRLVLEAAEMHMPTKQRPERKRNQMNQRDTWFYNSSSGIRWTSNTRCVAQMTYTSSQNAKTFSLGNNYCHEGPVQPKCEQVWHEGVPSLPPLVGCLVLPQTRGWAAGEHPHKRRDLISTLHIKRPDLLAQLLSR